ncbi:MAG: energy transducer TonB [Limnobacter sp.]|nr:energy transducer TonB [Limnobacter sp.]
MASNAWSHSVFRHAVLLSVLVHVGFGVVQCTAPSEIKQVKAPLEVILVNARAKSQPDNARLLAQVAMDGGGQADSGRATTTPSNAEDVVSQRELTAARERLEALETLQRELQGGGLRFAPPQNYGAQAAQAKQQAEQSEQTEPGIDPKDQRALEMQRLQAQISDNIKAYNERPRKHFFSPKTSPYEFAIYEEAWRTRVEQIGNQNYPEELKGKIYGKLRLTVYIKSDGSIDNVEIDRSSGSAVLDRAALKLLRLSAPFPVFPSEMRTRADILAITRTWIFSRDHRISNRNFKYPP